MERRTWKTNSHELKREKIKIGRHDFRFNLQMTACLKKKKINKTLGDDPLALYVSNSGP